MTFEIVKLHFLELDGAVQPSGIVDLIEDSFVSPEHQLPPTLVVCLPQLLVESSNSPKYLFEAALPLQNATSNMNMETLPWTVTSKNFSILTLFSQQVNGNSRDEVYLCRPVSWTLFIASATRSEKQDKSKLEIIQEDSNLESKKELSLHVSAVSDICTQSINIKKECKSSSLGFVLHMDWSVSEWFISHDKVLVSIFFILVVMLFALKNPY